MANLLRDDEGEIRLMGSQSFIDGAIRRISATADVSYDGNIRANRHGAGHRAHAHLRLTDVSSSASTSLREEDDEPPAKAAAEQAKARRDIAGEIEVLTTADHDLRRQPWFPIQPGDVVCWSVDFPDGDHHAETLVAVDEPDRTTDAGAPLRKVSETPHPGDGHDQDDPHSAHETSDYYEDFYDIWFEAGPASIAVIRHGRLVHGSVRAGRS